MKAEMDCTRNLISLISPFACSYKGYCTLVTEVCAFRYVFVAYIALSDLECSDQSSCVVLEEKSLSDKFQCDDQLPSF